MPKQKIYTVPHSFEVNIGNVKLGAAHDVVVQSMANTNTCDIDASVQQFIRMADSGAQLVRFTTQGLKEVEALSEIKKTLTEKNIHIPIVADVHFNAKVAFEAARICDKVRINPGNFTEKSHENSTFSENEFQQGLEENKAQLLALITLSKANNTALRIGVNHGSLSKRIMSRYGDTAEGMVESAMEFIRICQETDYHALVISLKSSNSRMMVYAVRLLVNQMLKENLYYPIHLGLTESGDGLEGRIKSVVGLAPLLMEGMGDTIRISLTEPPEDELPVAIQIREAFQKPKTLPFHPFENLPWNPFHYEKIPLHEVMGIGGKNPPIVISDKAIYKDPVPDILSYMDQDKRCLQFQSAEKTHILYSDIHKQDAVFIRVDLNHSPQKIAALPGEKIIVLDAGTSLPLEIKSWLISYVASSGTHPLILHKKYTETTEEKFALKAAGEYSLLLIDGLLSGIWIENPNMPATFTNWLSFYMLQASRNRTTSTEYIACPSCGRTLFDIQTVLKEVRSKTSHLKGLKIAVMGCIVNGPGEMADADYGYIGSGHHKVSIYKGLSPVRKNIPTDSAVESLIEVIRENGDWKNP